MFKKIALIGLIALSPQLQVYAAGCDVPTKARFDWDNGVTEQKYCQPGTNCIIDWNGYGWWTNFHANKKEIWFGETGQPVDPRNATVEHGRLKLMIKRSDLGGGMDWSAAEAVLVRDKNGQPMNIGYGHYLFTYELPVPVAQMDIATVFGAFTYYRQNIKGVDQGHSGAKNNLKELDMIELSKWGWNGRGECPFKNGNEPKVMCGGSAQMGTQPWEQSDNLNRYDLPATGKIFTVYMDWPGPQQQVKFKVFSGVVNMATAQSQPGDLGVDWETPNTQYIPSLQDEDNGGQDACVRFHFNFYRPIYSSAEYGRKQDNISLFPARETAVYVNHFEYQPK